MGSVTLSAIALSLSNSIVGIAGGNLFLLLFLAAIASFVMGLGMASIPCYIFVAIMVAPALEKIGMPQIVAHLYVFWWAVSFFITPPVGISFFVAAAIAKADVMKTGWLATYIGIANYFIPFAFVYNQGLMLMGPIEEIITSIIAAFIAVMAVAAAFQGYLLTIASPWQRLVLALGGVVILYPPWPTRLAGLILILAVAGYQYKSRSVALVGPQRPDAGVSLN